MPSDLAVEKRRIALFFIITFAITWSTQLPGALAINGYIGVAPEKVMPLMGLGLFGPMFAAMILSMRRRGGGGVKGLFAQVVDVRAKASWFALALLLSPVAFLFGMFVFRALGGQGELFYVPQTAPVVVAMLLIPFTEDIGWRGFAFPRLQRCYGPLKASLIFAPLWVLWHVPMFMSIKMPLSGYLSTIPQFLGLTLIVTWLMNRAGNKLPIAIIAHASIHLNNSHKALPDLVGPVWVHAGVLCLIALLVLIRDPAAWRRPAVPGVSSGAAS